MPKITLEELSKKTGVTTKTIQRDFEALGIIRVGGRKEGMWVVKKEGEV